MFIFFFFFFFISFNFRFSAFNRIFLSFFVFLIVRAIARLILLSIIICFLMTTLIFRLCEIFFLIRIFWIFCSFFIRWDSVIIWMSICSKAFSYVTRSFFFAFLLFLFLNQIDLKQCDDEILKQTTIYKSNSFRFFQLFDVILNERKQSKCKMIHHDRKFFLINRCFFKKFC